MPLGHKLSGCKLCSGKVLAEAFGKRPEHMMGADDGLVLGGALPVVGDGSSGDDPAPTSSPTQQAVGWALNLTNLPH